MLFQSVESCQPKVPLWRMDVVRVVYDCWSSHCCSFFVVENQVDLRFAKNVKINTEKFLSSNSSKERENVGEKRCIKDI